MKYWILWSLFGILPFCIRSTSPEFLYPIATYKKNVVLMHQTAPKHVSLLVWDHEKKELRKLLPEVYTPAHAQLLPNQRGFSFLHNDTLYIKHWLKRSPKRLEFQAPLYNIGSVAWLDSDHFIFHAKKKHYFRIFLGTVTNTQVRELISSDQADSMYPQKINETVYYIERDTQYRVVQTNMECSKKRVLYSSPIPMAFLNMGSMREGYFLGYSELPDAQKSTTTFSWHKLEEKNDNWTCTQLFTFSIPSHYLINNSNFRLYESITPFLPRSSDRKIYFSDCSTRPNSPILSLYSFDMPTGRISRETFNTRNPRSCFSPLLVDKELWYGFET